MSFISRDIPGLGRITTSIKLCEDTVVQFRGVPYGVVEQRFRQPQLCETWGGGSFEASKFGPACPSPATTFNLVGVTLKAHGPDAQVPADEFKCLNLNITTPIEIASNLLPVSIYFHGGMNCTSSANHPGYNPGNLVRLSMRLRSPIIVVTVNFRLGAFGFMASEDLKADNREAGYQGVGNYALYDQYTALKWVKKYISGFGGDPDQITAIGQSSGASDLHILMMSDLLRSEALLYQVVIISGNAVMTSREPEHQQRIYDKFLEHLQIPLTLPPANRLARLRAVKQQDLTSAYGCLGSPLPNWQATVDGIVLKKLPTCNGMSSQTYAPSIKRILVGDCEQEGILWGERIKQKRWTATKIFELLRTYFDPADVSDILRQHDIADGDSGQDLTPKLIKFCGEVEFKQPLYELAANWKNGEAFYYHMRFINRFEGRFKGSAHHGVDLLLFFQTYNHLLSGEYEAAAEEMGKHFIKFISGGSPWDSFNKAGSCMSYGPDRVAVIKQDEAHLWHQKVVGRNNWHDKCTLK
ncbi:hypothetical protein CEP54_010502 [Fusarium duplospermum]|uniref:Carboxylesterase type B domain-containing protein n=1 Tax=Fusarium duplospermum TaxID=1325734 RepID=A0A428PJP5_9HYPO|nr:hypothetical protein CEP54_010502 [Fusarium duplospermum]